MNFSRKLGFWEGSGDIQGVQKSILDRMTGIGDFAIFTRTYDVTEDFVRFSALSAPSMDRVGGDGS